MIVVSCIVSDATYWNNKCNHFQTGYSPVLRSRRSRQSCLGRIRLASSSQASLVENSQSRRVRVLDQLLQLCKGSANLRWLWFCLFSPVLATELLVLLCVASRKDATVRFLFEEKNGTSREEPTCLACWAPAAAVCGDLCADRRLSSIGRLLWSVYRVREIG